ncbi:MAG: tetratricopeptide repeat protein [Planctomycetes bacterium]|nr:tetratricopeptide repeat protein [Planctomycetota bacterium]MCA8936290.1 tetratricopeptide repeat protein [Planctomycetota bacterium]
MSEVARQLVSAARDAMADGDYRRAIYLCEQAIERDSRMPEAHQELADAREGFITDQILKAHDASKAGNNAEARRICSELLDLSPDDAEVIYTRSFFQDSEEEAKLDLMHVAAFDTKDAESLQRRASALEMLERLDEAEQVWSTLVELTPGDAENWVGRAEVRMSLFRDTEALHDVNEAVRLDPQSAEALVVRASLMRELGRFEEAIADAKRAKHLDSEVPLADEVIADALFRLDRYVEAEQAFLSLVEKPEVSASDWASYACVLTELGRPAEALELLLEEVVSDEREAGWHSAMAHALGAAERWDEAVLHLDEALSLDRQAVSNQEHSSLYELAWCLAHRVSLAEKHSSAGGGLGIDVEAERDEAASLLRQAIENDASSLLFAKSAREFDSLWSHPDLSDFVAS